MDETPRMRVEIWSDISCPWCYIGKARFSRALETFPQRSNVDVIHRSFELDPHLSHTSAAQVTTPPRTPTCSHGFRRNHRVLAEQLAESWCRRTGGGGRSQAAPGSSRHPPVFLGGSISPLRACMRIDQSQILRMIRRVRAPLPYTGSAGNRPSSISGHGRRREIRARAASEFAPDRAALRSRLTGPL